MSDHEGLSQWTAQVSSRFPHLSKPQAGVLAVWSYGMIVAKTCGLTTVALTLALILHQRAPSIEQRFREWLYDAEDKRGTNRQELDVTLCFAPLFRWLIAWWDTTCPTIVLALDASNLGDRWVTLAICVVYRGSAIPVAWAIVPAHTSGTWELHWRRFLRDFHEVVPADWTVLVTSDRGLYSRWLFQHIQHLGWHPLQRIQCQGLFRPAAEAGFRPLKFAAPTVGDYWCGQVHCFADPSRRLVCTLVAWWGEGYAEPWLLVTDLAPDQVSASWYGLRSWIESWFKDSKRGGWQWHHTKITDPARLTRFFLVVALATLWSMSVGGEEEVAEAEADAARAALWQLRRSGRVDPPSAPRRRRRSLSCFRRGVIVLGHVLPRGGPLPGGHLIPEPLPPRPPAVTDPATRRVPYLRLMPPPSRPAPDVIAG